jgi:hypothetical protein
VSAPVIRSKVGQVEADRLGAAQAGAVEHREQRELAPQVGDERGAVEDVGVGADETVGHRVLGVKQRGEDVVVRPVAVVAERELRVVGPDPLDPVAADEDDLAQPGGAERVERPVDDPPTADLGVALGCVVGQRPQPPPAPGPDNDRPDRALLAGQVCQP